ncbi:MAG: hypothetical protein LBR15_10205 [Methanobrevibacter sp.]|jgi:hypothetical protein|nr:hypothetical protein [Candidatus Methanovirga australis]
MNICDLVNVKIKLSMMIGLIAIVFESANLGIFLSNLSYNIPCMAISTTILSIILGLIAIYLTKINKRIAGLEYFLAGLAPLVTTTNLSYSGFIIFSLATIVVLLDDFGLGDLNGE